MVNDLADTMQSLQTIAEQCLPETWENDSPLINTVTSSEENTCNSLSLDQFVKCQFCQLSFIGE